MSVLSSAICKKEMDDKMLKVVLVQNFLQRMAVSNEIDRLPSQTKSVVVQSGPAATLAASLEAATREMKNSNDFKKQSKIGRTIHTLYGFSFVIYFFNVLCDWMHIVLACQGYSVNFEFQGWIVVTMVIICVNGSIFTSVLLVLCIENAFYNRTPWDPFANGFELIFDEAFAWLTNFTCFRVAFLVLVLQDAPMIFCNFWFISACRIANGAHMWPVLASSISSMVSLMWRLVMLYYAYRHFWFFKTNKRQLTAINRESSTIDELKTKVGVGEPDRMRDFDECWPVRYSHQKTIARIGTVDSLIDFDNQQVVIVDGDGEVQNENLSHKHKGWMARCASMCCCGCMCLVLYIGMCFTACVPCIYHYGCKKQSIVHRNRFAKTCTRITTTGYHMFILLFTFTLTIMLIIVNGIFLTSVHLIGPNTVTPEIGQICIALDYEQKKIWPYFSPTHKRITVNSSFHEDCIPVLEDHRKYKFGFLRYSKYWKLHKAIQTGQVLTMWTSMDFRPKDLRIQLDYNFKKGLFECEHREASGWTVVHEKPKNYPWPYFCACHPNYQIDRTNALSCNGSGLSTLIF